MDKMKEWRCPKCSVEVQALANAVAHRCPSNKSIFTSFEQVEEKK